MTETLQQIASIVCILAATFGIVVIFLVYRALVAEKLVPKLPILGGEPKQSSARTTPRDRAAENIRRLNGGDSG